MGAMVGGLFPPVTVKTNVSLALCVSSLTVTGMIALPVWLVAGVIVTVLLAPLPPKTMLGLGTREVLLELPVRIKLFSGVSISATVNGIAEVGVFIGID